MATKLKIVQHYQTVSSGHYETMEAFDKDIEECLEEGWELHGAPFCFGENIIQALTYFKEVEKKDD